MPVNVKCAHCKKPFTVSPSKLKISKSVFCSHACYAKSKIGKAPANKNTITYKCEECGKSFSKAASAKPRFCGRKCFHAWHKRFMVEKPSNPKSKVNCTCESCGKHFEIWPSRTKKGEGRFCSYDCLNAWKRTVRGDAHPLKKEYIVKLCQWCKVEYKCKPSKSKKSHFCSRQCVGAWISSQNFSPTTIEIAIRELLISMGVLFQEQKPMGKFVCDFVVKSSYLAIECDGDYWHSLPQVAERDKRKDSWLTSHKYKVLRLPEHKIRNDIEWCKKQIIKHL